MSTEQSSRGQSIALAVVALLAGILIGVVGAHSFNITDETVTTITQEEPASQTPSAELRAALDAHMAAHVYLTKEAMIAVYEDTPAAPQRLEAMEANATELADALSVIDNVDAEEMAEPREQRLEAVRAYAVAAREQDQESMREAREQLEVLSAETARLLSQELDVSQDELEDDLTTHVAHMEQILNAYVAENYQEVRREELRAREHMQELSKKLSADIVTTYSERFGP